MKKLLVSLLLLAAPMLSFADGAVFTIPAGTTQMIVAATVDGSRINNMLVRSNSTAYAAGTLVNHRSAAYVAQIGGTSGSYAPTGTAVMVDGSVTWLLCPTKDRVATIIQKASGGTLDLFFSGGKLTFTVDGSALTISYPSAFSGAIYGASVASNTVVNVTNW